MLPTQYAEAGRATQTTDSWGATTTLVYDAAGHTIGKTNGRGTTCFHYDGEGRLTSEQAPGDPQATTFTYDPAGAQRTATDASGTLSTLYDEAGRGTQTTDSWGATAAMGYDADGNLLAKTETPPGGSAYTTSYAYNALDQPTSETDAAGKQWQFFYDSRSNLKATQYPNGTFSWIDTNPLGQTTNYYNRHGSLGSSLPASVPSDSSPIADFAYSYNADGQKTQEVRTAGGIATQTTNYTYDALGRLSHVDLPSGVGRDYSYDLDSNRTAITENGSQLASHTYDPVTTAGVDELTSVTKSGTTTSYRYSSDGQVKSRGADAIGWDGWGRMSGGTFNGTSVTYGFDASGAWRSRTSGAKTTRYLLGDDFETDGTGALTASYTPGPGGDLAQYSGPPTVGTTVSFLYYDDHGNLVAEADTTGTRTAAHTYDPFGAPLDSQRANSTVHRFTGRWDKQYDTTSTLIQMGARPYDPSIGRFLAVDPVEGGSLNNYDYAGQDPINNFDLDGTCSRKKEHSWNPLTFIKQPGCFWGALQDDASGRNGKVMQFVTLLGAAIVTRGAGRFASEASLRVSAAVQAGRGTAIAAAAAAGAARGYESAPSDAPAIVARLYAVAFAVHAAVEEATGRVSPISIIQLGKVLGHGHWAGWPRDP